MLGKMVLTWMLDEERTVAYLARQSGINPDRLVDLILSQALPADDELNGLAQATGMTIDQPANDERELAAAVTDPLHCYTVGQAAALLGVSEDTVRKEVRTGALHHVVLGERVLRIPRYAIQDRISGQSSPRPPAHDFATGPVEDVSTTHQLILVPQNKPGPRA